MSPCVLGLGFIKCIWSNGHCFKHDNRWVIWSMSAIWERGDIREIWWGITPPAPVLSRYLPGVFWYISMLGSRWVTTSIDNSSELNWNKTNKNRLFSPTLSWVDLLVTLRWPCYDLGVKPLSSLTPTHGKMCTWVEIYPMYLKYRTGKLVQTW